MHQTIRDDNISMKKKIGWQKYENVIEEQISSTFFLDIIKQFYGRMNGDEIVEEEELDDAVDDSDVDILSKGIMMPMNPKIFDELSMITNFDCWIGHTNFDITNDTKKILDATEGVEVLKIFSRYRFFIGVGKMFKFQNVRNNIEKELLKGDL
jgi:hypothetical protein